MSAVYRKGDLYEHILEDDLKQSAIIADCFIYQAAMRDEKLPRKSLPGLGAQ